MKTTSLFLLSLCVASLGVTVGCSKQESAPPVVQTETPAATEAKKATDTAAADMQKAADKAAADAKEQADKVAADAKAQAATAQATADKAAADAQAQSASLTSKTQSLIERVKALLAEKKPAEAMTALSELATAKLTPEQQATVNSLKQQAQALMQEAAAGKASDAVGGLLNKK
jgi:hypothetical protein